MRPIQTTTSLFVLHNEMGADIFLICWSGSAISIIAPCVRRFAAEKELEAQPEDLDESPACHLFAGRGDTPNVLRARQKVILQR